MELYLVFVYMSTANLAVFLTLLWLSCGYLEDYTSFTIRPDFRITVNDLSGCTACLFVNRHPSFIIAPGENYPIVLRIPIKTITFTKRIKNIHSYCFVAVTFTSNSLPNMLRRDNN